MNNNFHAEVDKLSRLVLSKEYFQDYLTALLSRIRQSRKCEATFTGKTLHPLIGIQRANHLSQVNINYLVRLPGDFLPCDVKYKTNSRTTMRMVRYGGSLWVTRWSTCLPTRRGCTPQDHRSPITSNTTGRETAQSYVPRRIAKGVHRVKTVLPLETHAQDV